MNDLTNEEKQQMVEAFFGEEITKGLEGIKQVFEAMDADMNKLNELLEKVREAEEVPQLDREIYAPGEREYHALMERWDVPQTQEEEQEVQP